MVHAEPLVHHAREQLRAAGVDSDHMSRHPGTVYTARHAGKPSRVQGLSIAKRPQAAAALARVAEEPLQGAPQASEAITRRPVRTEEGPWAPHARARAPLGRVRRIGVAAAVGPPLPRECTD